jgi:hypothetical protein
MVESIYFLQPAWCGTHPAGLWPEQDFQSVTRATAFQAVACHLAARLNITLPGVDQQTAESLVNAGSNICPYSLATKGNVEVEYNVVMSDLAAGAGRPQHA